MPPQAIETEERLLASILSGIGEDAFELISETDFYSTPNRLRFEACQALHEKGEPVELVTVVEYLRSHGQLEQAGGAAAIASLVDTAPVMTGGSEYYCDIIREKAMRRQIIEKCNRLAQAAFRDQDIDIVLDTCQRQFLTIGLTRGADKLISYRELADRMPERWEELNGRKGVTGVPTGLDKVDRMTGGLQAGDLIVPAARPGMGKTALALAVAEGAASSGFPVIIFSLEMPAEQLYSRHTAKAAGVDSQKFRVGGILNHEWGSIIDAQDRLYELPINIDETPRQHYMEIVRRSRRAVRELGVRLIIIDYLQLIQGGNQQRKDLEVAEITGTLKALAKELRLPVVLLSQLNRAVEARDNKRPRLSDLRESGAIEQDADIVCFIYRDEYYNPNTQEPGVAELSFGKNRNGRTGIVKLRWIGWRCCFENL
jgi:replicative DNA helicase